MEDMVPSKEKEEEEQTDRFQLLQTVAASTV